MNNTSILTSNNETNKSICDEVLLWQENERFLLNERFWFVVVAGCFVACVGTLATLFLIGLLASRKHLLRSSLLYLFVIAFLDLGLFCIYFLLIAAGMAKYYFNSVKLHYAWNEYVSGVFCLGRITQFAQTYLIIAATIERIILLSEPNSTHASTRVSQCAKFCKCSMVCTTWKRCVCIAVIIVVSILYKGCSYWEVGYDFHAMCEGFAAVNTVQGPIFFRPGYLWFRFYIDPIPQVYVPFCLLTLLNLAILVRARSQGHLSARQMSVGSEHSENFANSEHSSDFCQPDPVPGSNKSHDEACSNKKQENNKSRITNNCIAYNSGVSSITPPTCQQCHSGHDIGSLQMRPTTSTMDIANNSSECLNVIACPSVGGTWQGGQQDTILHLHSKSVQQDAKPFLQNGSTPGTYISVPMGVPKPLPFSIASAKPTKKQQQRQQLVYRTPSRKHSLENGATSGTYVVRHRKVARAMDPSHTRARPRAVSFRDATRTMVAIVTCYLVSNALHVVVTFLEQSNSDILANHRAAYTISSDISSFLVILTSAIRLPIYYLCCRQIRVQIKYFFRKTCSAQRGPRSPKYAPAPKRLENNLKPKDLSKTELCQGNGCKWFTHGCDDGEQCNGDAQQLERLISVETKVAKSTTENTYFATNKNGPENFETKPNEDDETKEIYPELPKLPHSQLPRLHHPQLTELPRTPDSWLAPGIQKLLESPQSLKIPDLVELLSLPELPELPKQLPQVTQLPQVRYRASNVDISCRCSQGSSVTEEHNSGDENHKTLNDTFV